MRNFLGILATLLITSCGTFQLSTINYDPIYASNGNPIDVTVIHNEWEFDRLLRTDFRFRYNYAQYAISQPISFDWHNRYNRYNYHNQYSWGYGPYWNRDQMWMDWVWGYPYGNGMGWSYSWGNNSWSSNYWNSPYGWNNHYGWGNGYNGRSTMNGRGGSLNGGHSERISNPTTRVNGVVRRTQTNNVRVIPDNNRKTIRVLPTNDRTIRVIPNNNNIKPIRVYNRSETNTRVIRSVPVTQSRTSGSNKVIIKQ